MSPRPIAASPVTHSQLRAALRPLREVGVPRPVHGVRADSRAVGPTTAFVAISGTAVDGHRFVPAAVQAGAPLVVVERWPDEDLALGDTWLVQVTSCREALGRMAQILAGSPAAGLGLVGITGTNGKTTTAALIEQLLLDHESAPLVLGTTGHRLGDHHWPSRHTTPGPVALAGLMAEAVDLGATRAVLEVSSHALDQHRVEGLRFDVAAFTNLTQDHLDYHETLEAYLAAKLRLFEGTPEPPRRAVVFGSSAPAISVHAAAKKAGVERWAVRRRGGQRPASERALWIEGETSGLTGCRFALVDGSDRYEVRCTLPGAHNVENAAVAIASVLAAGVSLPHHIQLAPGRLAGRLERVDGPPRPVVFVDYAHTPDGLERVCRLLAELSGGALTAVFGCGGDRDQGKRPLMGRAAERWTSDLVLTSDNPRSEDPMVILEQIRAGLERPRQARVEVDRGRAIQLAIAAAAQSEATTPVVLIAGKGHERVQLIGDEARPFDDVQEARRALATLDRSHS